MNSVGHWFGYKLQSVLALDIMRVVEASVLGKVPIDLLDFRNLPAVMLLGKLAWHSIVFGSCNHFSFSLESNLMGRIIDFLSQSLSSLHIMVPVLVAIELFPSFSLSGGLNYGSCCKYTSISVSVNQIGKEHISIISHILCFVQHVKSIKLVV